MRTSWCGQVIAPKASARAARSSERRPRPSGPPMTRRQSLGAAVAPAREPSAKAAAVEALAALVEGDERRRPAATWRGAPPLPRPCGRRRCRRGFRGIRGARRSGRGGLPAVVGAVDIAVEELALGPGLQPADGGRSRSSSRRPLCRPRRRRPRSRGADPLSRRPGRVVGEPHLLDVVEGADFRPEDVDDDVAGIDQHPIAVRAGLRRGCRAPPASFRSSTSRSAMAPTCRCERPEATTM